MATILVKDFSDELFLTFATLAAQKGLTLEEAVIEAIKKYVESFSVEARLQQISNRVGISIDPAEISNIIKDERNKR